MLRHRSLNTTLIYAKLDSRNLRAVALPWPGSAQHERRHLVPSTRRSVTCANDVAWVSAYAALMALCIASLVMSGPSATTGH